MKVTSASFQLLCFWSSMCLILSEDVWHEVKVALTSLSFTVGEIEMANSISCALLASRMQWPSLFCFQDSKCFFSNLTVTGLHDDSALGDVASCWTIYSCLVDDVYYKHGETFRYGCEPALCLNHMVVIKPVVPDRTSCTWPFFEMPSVGCFYTNWATKSYCDARYNCLDTFGVDLAVPDDYDLFRYNWSLSNSDQAWIGIYDGKWLNGKVVPTTGDHWGPAQPDNGPGMCVKFHKEPTKPGFFMFDSPCHERYNSICELKLN